MTALHDSIRAAVPSLRGRLVPGASLADLTWFRVGGPAEVLFTPADEEDLAALLAAVDPAVPVTVIGLGSNLIVRDGGIPGVTVRLGGKAFGTVEVDGTRIRAGTPCRTCGWPRRRRKPPSTGSPSIGGFPARWAGALRMNAGAHGGETTDVFVEARGIDRRGNLVRFDHGQMGFSYRHCAAPEDVIFTSALFEGRPGDRAAIEAEMDRVTAAREAAQPIRERTGGSTFANPEGGKAWQLVDAAGCRGLTRGGAQVSEMHCNFLINRGGATAADIEGLGEEVRRRVRETSGVALRWEIKRIGVPMPAAA